MPKWWNLGKQLRKNPPHSTVRILGSDNPKSQWTLQKRGVWMCFSMGFFDLQSPSLEFRPRLIRKRSCHVMPLFQVSQGISKHLNCKQKAEKHTSPTTSVEETMILHAHRSPPPSFQNSSPVRGKKIHPPGDSCVSPFGGHYEI